MIRVLEFLTALAIAIVVGVVVSLVLPSHGHVERSAILGKDLRQVYDELNNFGGFSNYAALRTNGGKLDFTTAGAAFGSGAQVSWRSSDSRLNGDLKLVSSAPRFDQISTATAKAQIVWQLNNAWRGGDKHFTIDLQRQGSRGQLTHVTWAYDVDFGWNPVNRYAYLFLNGEPASFIQYSLAGLQNLLGSMPNVDYTDLVPYIVKVPATPVLAAAGSSERKGGLDALNEAIEQTAGKLKSAAAKLGVKVTGPRVVFTKEYGEDKISFDVAFPISAASLTVAGQQHSLTASKTPGLSAASAGEGSRADHSDDSAAKPLAAGTQDRFGRLVVNADVRAYLAFGGEALEAKWKGNGAGVPLTRDLLGVYAQTHGYAFDTVVAPAYDILETKGGQGADQVFAVYLPLKGQLPAQTPEQGAGKPLLPAADAAPSSAASAPASK